MHNISIKHWCTHILKLLVPMFSNPLTDPITLQEPTTLQNYNWITTSWLLEVVILQYLKDQSLHHTSKIKKKVCQLRDILLLANMNAKGLSGLKCRIILFKSLLKCIFYWSCIKVCINAAMETVVPTIMQTQAMFYKWQYITY